MTVVQALEYIHRTEWRKSKLGLERMRELLRLLGNPDGDLRFVHVAGTNGKGSVCAMLSCILRASGYRTGLYISPYIRTFHERIQVDGVSISDDELARATQTVAIAADSMEDHPTEFEMVCAIGFIIFLQKKCDVVVLEVGLGGRLDATNVIGPPLMSVITSIGLDHTDMLGPTIDSIAREKCGIIKPSRPCVSAAQVEPAMQVILETCTNMGSELHVCDLDAIEPLSDSLDGQTFQYKGRGPYDLCLLGRHQLHNASLVLECVQVLNKIGYPVREEAVVQGLNETRWPARLQVLCRQPLFILDGAHNVDGARTAAAAAARYCGSRVVLLCGVLGDKDYPEMLAILNEVTVEFILASPSNSRAMDAERLLDNVTYFGKPAIACESISQAVEYAMKRARELELPVLACGSLYLAGDILNCFEGG